MAKYIDADKLLKTIEDSVSEYSGVYSSDMLNMWGLFTHIINEQEAADVVEVVRCKSCKHGSGGSLTACPNIRGVWYAEDYCSYGERKDG